MSRASALAGVVVLSSLAACRGEGGPNSVRNPRFWPEGAATDAGVSTTEAPATGDGGSASGPTAPVVLRCVPARAQPLPARVSAMSAVAVAPRERTMFTNDLFGLFKSHCGGCHVETRLGGFQATRATFARTVDRKVIDTMKLDDPSRFMPPLAGGGRPYSKRGADDPIVSLVGLLELWLAQGRPDDAFRLGGATPSTASPFVLTEEVGTRMTNLGDCVAEGGPAGRGASSRERMETLDGMFAKATALPPTLAETDLFTLDGQALAESGVVAFVPAYPLFSDDAAKIRHIRVPRGQSVRFDKARQTFDIPTHTRFYKTFLKEVVDRAGRKSYRKMETRLIVARPDRRESDGAATPTALFGTYVWNDDETEAVLLRDPLRNGKPFRDRIVTYALDEPKVQKVIDSKPANLTFALEEENRGVLRRYAIPGSDRCVQCHMGSPGGDFVLGFLPLQIARRRTGEGGTYEETSPHELTQLQRLVAYGVITGVTSDADLLPLERSQPGRSPRSDLELRAQGYLLGNCAACHNPRGFPSVKSPELKDMLDFLPSATGGAFEFPLDRMSPLRKRGIEQDVPMPYITPSLREYPVNIASNGYWMPKWVDCKNPSAWVMCGKRKPGPSAQSFVHVDAPWRSLIYRNVDAPFAYADDFVVFPRMPMHGAGHDCRAARILGEWMVSIPSVRKQPEIPEDAVPLPGVPVDRNPQPYVEVKPDDPRFAAAQADAQRRLTDYRTGGRFELCPENRDVLDPTLSEERADGRLVPESDAILDAKDKKTVVMPNLGVPVRAHWVVTDLTEAPGDWHPRRPDWQDMILRGEIPAGLEAAALEQQKSLASVLKKVTLTEELRRFALTEVPFGLWAQKPACGFKGVPRAAEIPAARRPAWMQEAPPSDDAPVYMQAPGAAIYRTICQNCHGPAADSRGLLAEAIMTMTGGDARVASFRDGLFGPLDKPGANLARLFGASAQSAGKAEDVAARYLTWMALGGTERKLPAALLNIVAVTKVLGEGRKGLLPSGSPNMLQLAQELCNQVLYAGTDEFDLSYRLAGKPAIERTALITKNGDAEMWQRLCTLDNKQYVRVVTWNRENAMPALKFSSYRPDRYPADAEVLDHRGKLVKGIDTDNFFPVCIRLPAQPDDNKRAREFIAKNPLGGADGPKLPPCPDALFMPDDQLVGAMKNLDTGADSQKAGDAWALRGAVNAGFAVFTYLEQLSKGTVKPTPPFNRCEELAP